MIKSRAMKLVGYVARMDMRNITNFVLKTLREGNLTLVDVDEDRSIILKLILGERLSFWIEFIWFRIGIGVKTVMKIWIA